MAIPMPDEQALPPGPRRDLVEDFHALYRSAGRPGTRKLADAIRRNGRLPTTVAHETLAGLLHGRSVPDWPRLESVVRHLASVSVVRPDADELVLGFHDLWNAERDAIPTVPVVETITPNDWFTVMQEEGIVECIALEQAGLRPDEPLTLRTAMLLIAWTERVRNAYLQQRPQHPPRKSSPPSLPSPFPPVTQMGPPLDFEPPSPARNAKSGRRSGDKAS